MTSGSRTLETSSAGFRMRWTIRAAATLSTLTRTPKGCSRSGCSPMKDCQSAKSWRPKTDKSASPMLESRKHEQKRHSHITAYDARPRSYGSGAFLVYAQTQLRKHEAGRPRGTNANADTRSNNALAKHRGINGLCRRKGRRYRLQGNHTIR